MKPLEFVFQGLTRRHHVDVLKEICAIDDLEALLISVAFATSNGVALVESEIQAHRANAKAWVGVRNDVTSWQGLCALLPIVRELYVVDTAIRHRIFHPKVYLSKNDVQARIAVGSANLTTGGLSQNIEASALLKLDLGNAEHEQAIDDLEALLTNLATRFPDHVKRVRRQSELDALLAAGVIIDETVNSAPRPATSRAVSTRPQDTTERMPLFGGPLPPRRPRATAAATARSTATRTRTPATGAPTAVLRPTGGVRPIGFELVWQSKPLTRRDLNIPTGANTNPTGSMLFKKGEWEGIDQRHYFYDEVFDALTWTPDTNPRMAHKMRAEAEFELVIKNISYGVHRLHLSHNTDTTSGAYLQNNSMTDVSWGAVKPFVARDDLLGRTLYLYKNAADPTKFMIEID